VHWCRASTLVLSRPCFCRRRKRTGSRGRWPPVATAMAEVVAAMVEARVGR
jgi:hypothetical protein